MDGEQTMPGTPESIDEITSSDAAVENSHDNASAQPAEADTGLLAQRDDAVESDRLGLGGPDEHEAHGDQVADSSEAPEEDRTAEDAPVILGAAEQPAEPDAAEDRAEPDTGTEQAARASQSDGPDACADENPASDEDGTDPEPTPAVGTAPESPLREAPQGAMPRFLTREEYESFGDDPEPLPQGFEVIDGGPDASVPREILEAARNASEPKPAPTRNLATAATEAASSVGNLIAHGVGAVREVSAAKRAHAEARGTLEELAQRIEDQSRELAYRQDVTARFADIVSEQNERKMCALRRKAQAQAELQALRDRIASAKDELEQMKDADVASEKRLKAALDSAEAHEESARESATRVKRRLSDAERALDKAREDRKTAVEAAERAVRAAEDRLSALRSEYAELQRNPSANSAVYSVREGELAAEISDAVEELRRANGELPRIREEVERTLAAAQTVYDQAKEPIEEAKAEFRAVSDETAAAREALESARKDASARQRELKDALRDLERSRKQQEDAEAAADQESADAEASIERARDIHAHPEVTERLAAALTADRAEAAETQDQVAQLAEAEQSVRERTRASRMKLGLAAGCGIAVVLLIVALWALLFA